MAVAPPVEAARRVRVPYPRPGASPVLEAAIAATWPVELHREALNVGWCESRGKPGAWNGKYGGLFQMGPAEWRKYGSGNDIFDAYDNAAAAFRYYTDVGSWRPWQCQP